MDPDRRPYAHRQWIRTGYSSVSHVYVTSDWHIGHTGVHEKFRTQFVSLLDHDDYILRRARQSVTKKDVLIVLGDITWTTAGIHKIKEAEFPCKLIMVGGNHDTLPVEDYLYVFDEVRGVYAYKRFWLTHMPVHPNELLGRTNVHGHCHRGGPWETHEEKGYYNAILEFNDYAPVDMRHVHKVIQERT